jgi:predicted DNA-binding transcriptional regulator AlpA
LLPIAEVCKRVRISRSQYFKVRSEGGDPREIRLSKQKVFISEAALKEWLGGKESGRVKALSVNQVGDRFSRLTIVAAHA